MEIENVNGKSNAALTLGIIGTALASVMGLGAGSIGIMNASGNTASSNFVTKDELKMVQDLSTKDSEIALLQAEKTAEAKMIEVYRQSHAETAALEATVQANYAAQNAWNTSQSVANAQMSAAVATNNASISALSDLISGLTKTVIPADNVCPKPMAQYNSWTAPTTTTTAT